MPLKDMQYTKYTLQSFATSGFRFWHEGRSQHTLEVTSESELHTRGLRYEGLYDIDVLHGRHEALKDREVLASVVLSGKLLTVTSTGSHITLCFAGNLIWKLVFTINPCLVFDLDLVGGETYHFCMKPSV